MIKNTLLITVLLMFFVQVYAQTCSDGILSTAPDGRYSINDGGDEEIDLKTGLIWKKCSLGQSGTDCTEGAATLHSWQDALQQVEIIRQSSGIDWRLPNINELGSLVEEKCYSPSINSTIFPNTASSSYWSSSSSTLYSTNAWSISFNYGHLRDFFKFYRLYIRLVRE